jgi:hypothetical protein
MHLTDGAQNSGRHPGDQEADNKLVETAIETLRENTKKVYFGTRSLPSSVIVDLFLQVGKDPEATKWLAKMDDKLTGVDVISQFTTELESSAPAMTIC